jgi:hypothetical protein
MADSDRPHSPFAGKLDFSARTPVRVLPLDEIEQMLAAHRLYLETERRQGSRADFGSAGLSGHNFSGLNLRRIKEHSRRGNAASHPDCRAARRNGRAR